jgi:hypothetical protein
MSQLTKQQLIVENNTSFPNNNAGLITPTLLRQFNTDMIDSNVNQTIYTSDSASFDSRIEAISSGSTGGTGILSSSNQTFVQFSSSVDTRLDSLESFSSSLDVTFVNQTELAQATGSLLNTASFDNNTRNLTFTKADNSQFSVNIPDATGSVGTFVTTQSFQDYTSSNDGKVNSLINKTGSYATTGSNNFIGDETITGSLIVSSSTTQNQIIGVNGGNGTGTRVTGRFEVNGPLHAQQDAYVGSLYIANTLNKNGAGALIVGSDLTLQDPNNPPGSQNPINLIVSGSTNITGSLTASLQQGYAWVGGAGNVSKAVPTSSFGGGGSTDTGSLMVTGSVNVNVLTFTKGDGSTFDLTVASSGSAPAGTISSSQQVIDALPTGTVSGSSQLTSSYDSRYTLLSQFQSYTSSNDGKVNTLINATGSYATTGSNSFNGAQTISGSVLVSGSFNAPTFTVASVSTNAAYPVLFQSGSTISKDSVDTIVYNPSTNTLSVSSSAGAVNILNSAVSATTSSGNTQRISNLATTLVNSNVEGKYIGFSGDPSKVGAPSLASSTNPGMLAQSGSSPTFYVPLEFQASASFTDGRVTANRLFRAASSIEVSGSLNVSGSQSIQKGNLNLSGSFYIQSSSANLPEATGSTLLTYNQTTGQVAQTPYSSALPALYDVGCFYSTGSVTATANTSGSFTYDTSLNVDNITFSNGSHINIVKTGTYNIQFSIQIDNGSGAADVAVWLKKNGINVDDTSTVVTVPSNQKQVLALNLWAPANSGDYFELAYQSTTNNTSFSTIAASGNIPRSPAIIVTINQIR